MSEAVDVFDGVSRGTPTAASSCAAFRTIVQPRVLVVWKRGAKFKGIAKEDAFFVTPVVTLTIWGVTTVSKLSPARVKTAQA